MQYKQKQLDRFGVEALKSRKLKCARIPQDANNFAAPEFVLERPIDKSRLQSACPAIG
jgi:hypothetical protein